MNNFFTLFNQPVSFDIDMAALDVTLHELQRQHHPDVAADKQQAQRQSALINKAYNTLKNIDSRAIHLMEISGQIINLNDSIANLDFLDEAMELRIALADVAFAEDLAAKKQNLAELRTNLATKIAGQITLFKQYFANKDWTAATDITKKLKFLAKIDADIDKALLEAAQVDDDDDDLYV